MTIAFTKVRLPHGWLGNMAPFPVEWGGATWRTTEALFQARRFAEGDPVRELIRAEASPMGAKTVAKSHADRMVIAQQSGADLALMADVLRLKVAAHPQLAEWLLATGDEAIVEDCTSRPRGSGLFWGAARQADGTWRGENWLGRLWVALRADLRYSRFSEEDLEKLTPTWDVSEHDARYVYQRGSRIDALRKQYPEWELKENLDLHGRWYFYVRPVHAETAIEVLRQLFGRSR